MEYFCVIHLCFSDFPPIFCKRRFARQDWIPSQDFFFIASDYILRKLRLGELNQVTLVHRMHHTFWSTFKVFKTRKAVQYIWRTLYARNCYVNIWLLLGMDSHTRNLGTNSNSFLFILKHSKPLFSHLISNPNWLNFKKKIGGFIKK